MLYKLFQRPEVGRFSLKHTCTSGDFSLPDDFIHFVSGFIQVKTGRIAWKVVEGYYSPKTHMESGFLTPCNKETNHLPSSKPSSRWWFQTFFIFTSSLGNSCKLGLRVSDWLKPPVMTFGLPRYVFTVYLL